MDCSMNNRDFSLLVLHALNRSIEILSEKDNALLELWDSVPHSDDIITDEDSFITTLLMWALLVEDFT